ncbi:GNAT family N-acetyltransferase [Loktanella sp. Alg231-35]|uniref:GNAT family N-acetyltransferase n=1 Tax=Loktanella sp. Alg231-35 TaxID=1922220 RepID=UPI000D55FEB4|nr:N-acetyltransferase [Loktanella sp. Alg231-35]
MHDHVTLRPERAEDQKTLHALIAAAFAPMNFSDGTEADALDRLRRDGDLSLSLIATIEANIVGHVAFSPATVSGAEGDWFALGPIAIKAPFQRQGIGTKLSLAGLDWLKARGAAGCVLIGNPHVYGPMGFASNASLTHGDLPHAFVQFVSFTGTVPQGEVIFAPALR